jgi:hypothetical protein
MDSLNAQKPMDAALDQLFRDTFAEISASAKDGAASGRLLRRKWSKRVARIVLMICSTLPSMTLLPIRRCEWRNQ